jgi:hypothetical protein
MKKAGVVCSLVVTLFVLGCGQPTTLVSMSVTPTSAYQTGYGVSQFQFTAYGNFIHPTESRDITKEVTWTSAIPAIATVDSNGLLTTAPNACGETIITATAGKNLIGRNSADSQAEMNATATFTIYVKSVDTCPQPPSS